MKRSVPSRSVPSRSRRSGLSTSLVTERGIVFQTVDRLSALSPSIVPVDRSSGIDRRVNSFPVPFIKCSVPSGTSGVSSGRKLDTCCEIALNS